MANTTDNYLLNKPLVIIGAGGHACSVANIALSNGIKIEYFVDQTQSENKFLGYPVFSKIKDAKNLNDFFFAIAIGDNSAREIVHKNLIKLNAQIQFPTLIHPSANVSCFATIKEGAVVMPNANIGPNSHVGRFCIINTNASIDHDCLMNDFAAIAPGAVTGGGVEMGLRSAVLIGAIVKHKVKIGNDSILGAGSYLNDNLPSNVVAHGTPARIIRSRLGTDSYL